MYLFLLERGSQLKKPSKEKVKGFFVDLIFMIIACCIGCFSTVAVMLPNGLTSGGLTGIVRVIQNFVNVDFSILYYGGSLIILIIVTILLGFREARKILLLSIMYPAILMMFEYFNFQLLEEKDVILAAVFCGVFGGICSGIVFWRGYAFCGTDAIAKIVKKKAFPQVSLSKILLIIDAIIIICSAFIFGRNIALYALITQVIFSKTIDFVMYGFETKIVQVEIITNKVDEVSTYIMNELRRGVSEMIVVGAYTKQPHNKLVTLCSPRESVLIRKYMAEIDKTALLTIIHVDGVWGRGVGFSDINNDVF